MAKKPIKSKTTKSEFQLQQEEKIAAEWLEKEITKSKDSPISGLIDLTPALARVLVQRNPNNRHISWATVEKFARDITNNAWVLNGEPIIIASDGLLNDGQHRCEAIILADKAIKSVMIVGVDRETRNTLDQGRMRTIGDYLSMDGHEDTVALGAVAGLVWQWQKNGMLRRVATHRPTKGEVMALIERNPKIAASVASIPRANSALVGGRVVLGFCHFAFSSIGPKQEVEAFFYGLMNGDNLASGSAILYARTRLMGGQRLRIEEKAELLFRAWNFWRKEETVRTIALQGGELPLLEA